MNQRDANKIFTDFLESLTSCIERMSNTEEWKRIQDDLKISLIKSDIKGVKKLKIISNKELDMMTEEMNTKLDELSRMNVDEAVNELENAINKLVLSNSKIFVFSDGRKREISIELIMNYSESLFYIFMVDIDSRTNNHEIEIDFQLKYLDEIIKYMTDEYDIKELNSSSFVVN